jgi:NADH pyrophosphatase NudC (nudix superfamily)
MQKLLDKLTKDYTDLRFVPGQQFSWSPEAGEIIYKKAARGKEAEYSLLHETGHALLGHTGYEADFQLIRLEIEAWNRASELAKNYGIEIDDDHIQDCLDTYRNWLHKRSICPSCGTQSLQQGDFIHYRCHNCHTSLKVNADRFRRSYRSDKQAGAFSPF